MIDTRLPIEDKVDDLCDEFNKLLEGDISRDLMYNIEKDLSENFDFRIEPYERSMSRYCREVSGLIVDLNFKKIYFWIPTILNLGVMAGFWWKIS